VLPCYVYAPGGARPRRLVYYSSRNQGSQAKSGEGHSEDVAFYYLTESLGHHISPLKPEACWTGRS